MTERSHALLLTLGVLLGCGGGPAGGGPDLEGAPRARADAVSPALRAPFVRVLGTAQDGGLPHAGCSCERCEKAREDPRQRRLIASLALMIPASERLYLFDATPDLREQLALLRDLRGGAPGRVDRDPVDGIFLSHAHIGHYLGLAFFGFEAMHSTGLPVFCSERMADFLRGGGPWSQLVELGNIALREIEPGMRVDLGSGVGVTPVLSPHRDEYADTLGFVIAGPSHRLLYLPDTDSWQAWDRILPEVVAEIDAVILDGTFFSPAELPGRDVASIGHPLITDTMDRLQPVVDSRALEVFFTHLNHSNPALDPGSEASRVIEERGFRVLEEGAELPL